MQLYKIILLGYIVVEKNAKLGNIAQIILHQFLHFFSKNDHYICVIFVTPICKNCDFIFFYIYFVNYLEGLYDYVHAS